MRRDLVFSALLFLPHIVLAAFSLSQIPDGYPSGRPEAPYGSYETPYSPMARVYADWLQRLDIKVHGLSLLARAIPESQAETVFYLEYLTLGIMRKIDAAPTKDFTGFEREALLSQSVRLYRHIRQYAEGLNETMIRIIDQALPGPNGVQLRTENPRTGEVLYESNGRSEHPLTQKERQAFYDKKVADFLAAGGRMSDMHVFDSRYLEDLGEFTRLEYVERPDGKVWVTQAKAGHVLLAGGGKVRAAGQIVVIKDANSKRILAVVMSNASGNYKPDLLSVEHLAREMERQYGIPLSKLVVTKGEPFGTQTVAILLKARLVDRAAIQKKITEMDAQARELMTSPLSALPPSTYPLPTAALPAEQPVKRGCFDQFAQLIR